MKDLKFYSKANKANKNTGGKLFEIVKKLKILKTEKTDNEINEIIISLELPLGLHLFIMGNYTSLMGLELT